VGLAGIGAGVGVASVKSNVSAIVDGGSSITTTGTVALSAVADAQRRTGGPHRCDRGRRGPRGHRCGGRHWLGRKQRGRKPGRHGRGGNNVSVTAADHTDVDNEAFGAAIGSAAVGANISRATKTTHVTRKCSAAAT
jgi:hypothetical protein